MNTLAEIKNYKVYVDDLPVVYELVISDGKIVTTHIYNFNAENEDNNSSQGQNGFIQNCHKIIKVLFKKRPQVFEKVCSILTDAEMKDYCMDLKKTQQSNLI